MQGGGSGSSAPRTRRTVLELGAVCEAVGHDDVLVEVVRARGAVAFHLVDHLADGEDGGGGGGGGRGVGLHLRGGRGDALGAGLVGKAFICIQGEKDTKTMMTTGSDKVAC